MPTAKLLYIKRLPQIEDLSYEEAEAILLTVKGCDVRSYSTAGLLRGIQRRGLPVWDIKAPRPKRGKRTKPPLGSLFTICQVMGDYKVTEHEPYFGCRATPLGEALAHARLTFPKDLKAYRADQIKRTKQDRAKAKW